MSEIARVAHVEAQASPFEWTLPHERRAEIDAHWADRLTAAPQMFDGRVLLMHEVALEPPGVLRCGTFEASFKSFLFWKDRGFPGEPVFNCFGMAALRAADGAFILGEMNDGTSMAGRLYFPAGTPEPSDLDAAGRLDFEANIRRELEEETGLTAADVEFRAGWTIVRERAYVACMKEVRVAEDSVDLAQRLAAHNARQTHPELKALHTVRSPADYDRLRMPTFMVDFLDHALASS